MCPISADTRFPSTKRQSPVFKDATLCRHLASFSCLACTFPSVFTYNLQDQVDVRLNSIDVDPTSILPLILRLRTRPIDLHSQRAILLVYILQTPALRRRIGNKCSYPGKALADEQIDMAHVHVLVGHLRCLLTPENNKAVRLGYRRYTCSFS